VVAFAFIAICPRSPGGDADRAQGVEGLLADEGGGLDPLLALDAGDAGSADVAGAVAVGEGVRVGAVERVEGLVDDGPVLRGRPSAARA
jgi:hypothetical protein